MSPTNGVRQDEAATARLDDDALMSRADAAAFLSVSPRSLECGGLDVPFVRLTERLVRYRVGDLRAFIADRRRSAAAGDSSFPGRAGKDPE